MNRNKALLDSLMGLGRDMSKKEKAKSEPEFLKDEVCKHFLVGYCPGKTLGREIEAVRVEFDPHSVIAPCTKLHSVGIRTDFQNHKDYQKYLSRWEESLASLLDKGVREADDKVAREMRRHTEGIAPMVDQDRLCESCGYKYKLRLADINVRDTDGGKFKPDIHPDSELHKGWLKLRAKLDELDDKIRKRQEEQDKKKEEEKDSDGKDGKRDRGSRSGRRRDRDEDDEDDRRSRRRDRDDDDDDRKTRRTSRDDRDDDRRSRRRDRDDEDRDRRRDRSRSRDRRR
eukprot:gb/GFBE01082625.1/.p2 GENE.gb/GFBE01082625.1/~~gb/GFBE01082625.1/.p2  ORF type:complete len:285 (-),score=56.92 gb/GFBE01082625.1/:76-930(-)